MEALVRSFLPFRLLSCTAPSTQQRPAAVLWMILTCALFPAMTLAAPGECIHRGGNATCAAVVTAPWVYRYVDTGCSSNQSKFLAICEIWYEGYWQNGRECANSTPLTEGNMATRSLNWATRGGSCQIENHTLHPWLSPGQTIDTGWCAQGVVGPQYTSGVETTNWRKITTTGRRGTGCSTTFNEVSIVHRDRQATLTCPVGFTQRTNNGQVECVREQEEVSCPATDADSCPSDGDEIGRAVHEVGNPVSTGTGSKRQTEIDYPSSRPGGIKFVRNYHSMGGAKVPGHPEARTSSMNGYWSSHYDRYVFPVIPDTYAMAAVVRPGGYLKHFDHAGREIASPTRTRERIEKLVDGSGVLSGWRYYNASDETEHYNSEGRLLSITNRQGLAVVMLYSDASTPQAMARTPGLLVRVEDAFGRALNFSYDTSDRLSSLSDPAGNLTRYEYDGLGNLKTVVTRDVSGQEYRRQYHYENTSYRHALTGITDERGVRVSSWSYDSLGRAISSERANATDRHTLAFSVNSTAVTNPLGATTTYHYSSHNGVRRNTAITMPCESCGGSATALTSFDGNGFVASRTDFDGTVTHYTHDERGLELSRTVAVGMPLARTTTTTWHPHFRVPLEINEPGRRSTYTYDARGNRLSMTVTDTATHESRTTTYTYTQHGLIDGINGPRTDVDDSTNFDYDAQGNLTTITNALGHVTSITAHDEHGNPLVIVDPNGVKTELAYDHRQRLLRRTVAGATTQFDYDETGNMSRQVRPDGSFLHYTYDAAQRLTGISDASGNRIQFTLDAAGNRIQEQVYDPHDSLRRQLRQEYNAQGRVKKILGANDQVTELGYDARGNLTSMTEATRFLTSNQYDALGRIQKVTDAANGVTSYSYNALNQLTSVTDPKGLTTHYAVNAFGETTQLTSPDTGITRFLHDAAGNLIRRIDARGVAVEYQHDALNRLRSVDYPGTNEDVTYAYDGSNYGDDDPLPAGTANAIGRLTGTRGGGSVTSYAYEPRGLVSEQARVILNIAYRTRYQYDPSGRLTHITYPNGRLVSFRRDALGNIASVETTLSGTGLRLADQIGYLPFGPDSAARFGNGLISQKTHDLDYRISRIETGNLQSLNYYYDTRNNIDAIQDNLDASASQNFAHDATGRLTSAQGSYGRLAYGYDLVGNRLQETVMPAGSSASYTVDYAYATDSHRLLAITGNGSTTKLAYDAAGNTTQIGSKTFSYNQANRLSQASRRKLLGEYRYDSRGQRTTKKAGSTTTVYHYDLDGLLIAETDAKGNVKKEYVYLNGRPLSQISYRTKGRKLVYDTYYYHLDHLGTPQFMSNSSGQAAWKATQEPFGKTTVSTFTKSKPVNNLRFPGQYFDAETNLHDNWWRTYDPQFGRYLQSDLIGLAGGLNTYAYANVNPLLYSDPLGLMGSGGNAAGNKIMGQLIITYEEMLQQGILGSDQYFHCLAACRASKKSGTPDLVRRIMNEKEFIRDLPLGVTGLAQNRDRKSITEMLDDIRQDQAANELGLQCPEDVDCNKRCQPMIDSMTRFPKSQELLRQRYPIP